MASKINVLLLSSVMTAYSATVDTTALRTISSGFLAKTLENYQASLVNSEGAPPPAITLPTIARTVKNGNLYTVHFKEGGFVTLSTDNVAKPIIAYSLTGTTPNTEVNEAYDSLMNTYNLQIEAAKKSGTIDFDIDAQWEDLINTFLSPSAQASAQAPSDVISNFEMLYAAGQVGPLLQSTWNQGAGWNAYAPAVSGRLTYAGCVATSMGQVMKYHSFPSSGTGTRNNINFALSTYNFSAMSLTSATPDAALLLRHAGASVDMSYGLSGSGASPSLVAPALVNYFRYSPTTRFIARSTYTGDWAQTLKTEIDAGRPVIYAGYGTGGHSFVMDGYNSSNYFHFNFGWSGHGDGWYALDNIAPAGTNFSSNQNAVIGIKPGTFTKVQAQSIAGIRSGGDVYASGDLNTLTRLDDGASYKSKTSSAIKILPADLDKDGDKDDLLGLTSTGKIVYMNNFISASATWSVVGGTGVYKQIILADMDGDGYENEIVSIDAAYTVWTGTTTTMTATTTKAYYVVSGDLDGGGKNNDLFAINSARKMVKSTDGGQTWSTVSEGNSSFLYYYLSTWDSDGNGTRESMTRWNQYKSVARWVADKGWWEALNVVNGYDIGSLNSSGGNNDLAYLSTTGKIIWNSNYLAPTDSTVGVGYKSVQIVDADADGTKDDIIAINSATTISVFFNGKLSENPLIVPFSGTAQVEMLDGEGDGKTETMLIRSSTGTIYYTSSFTLPWIQNAKSLVAADLDGQGGMNDMVGVGSSGLLFKSVNGGNWATIKTPTTALYAIVGDYVGSNGMPGSDGKYGDIAYLGSDRKIYLSYDQGNVWSPIQNPLNVNYFGFSDYDANGSNSNLFAINTSGVLYVQKTTSPFFTQVGTGIKMAEAIDIDKDGKMDDFIAITAAGAIYKSEQENSWVKIPGTASFVEVGDFDSDGAMDDAAVLYGGVVYYSTDLTTWTKIVSGGIVSIESADLDGEDYKNDIVARASNGNVYYTTDRINWKLIPGNFKVSVVGDFGNLFNTQGNLIEGANANIDPNTSITKDEQVILNATWQGSTLNLTGMPEGVSYISLFTPEGKVLLQTEVTAKDGKAQISTNLKGLLLGMAIDAQGNSYQIKIVKNP